MKISRAHFRGCLLGGATGDAKAYGIKDGGKDLITDNTQLTSFTVDGLVWADDRAMKKGVYAYIPCLFYSYQKWYYTQTGSLADSHYSFLLDGEILKWEELFARRGKGSTTMNSLAGSINNKFGTLKNRINSNKGCGSVMRAAPIGMYFASDEQKAFEIGCESGALTHGHIDAIMPTGLFAYLVAGILQGAEVKDVASKGIEKVRKEGVTDDCIDVLEKSLRLANDDIRPMAAMEEIGKGLTADEALSLAIYLAIKYKDDFENAIITASTYDGNTDSIASICGNLLGAYLGVDAIPSKWVQNLELTDLIQYGADKLYDRVEGR